MHYLSDIVLDKTRYFPGADALHFVSEPVTRACPQYVVSGWLPTTKTCLSGRVTTFPAKLCCLSRLCPQMRWHSPCCLRVPGCAWHPDGAVLWPATCLKSNHVSSVASNYFISDDPPSSAKEQTCSIHLFLLKLEINLWFTLWDRWEINQSLQ